MLKIGDFSRLGQVSVRMLRHYDKLGLLTPHHVDHFTGYRYYGFDQLPRLNRILALKDLGLSLDQIGKLLNAELSAEQLKGMLAIRQAELEQTIAEEQQRLHRVAARLRHIEHEGMAHDYEVVMKQSDPFTMAGIRSVVPHVKDMKAYRCNGYEELYSGLQEYGIPHDEIELVIYHDASYTEEDIDMEIGVQVADDVIIELGDRLQNDLKVRRVDLGLPLASTIHHGNIWDIPLAVQALYQWVVANQFTPQGTIIEYHLSAKENDVVDISNITFEIQMPISVQKRNSTTISNV